jgi:nucleoside-diphosphate-sugar epimerase
MRVLIAAGTGFINGHVARAFLARGDAVYALVRSRPRAENDVRLRGARLVEGTLGAIPNEVMAEAKDVVVYAAGVWRRDDRSPADETARRCEEVYVRGVEALAEHALAWNAHFVFMSGVSRYGDAPWNGPLSEETPPGKLSVFGAHKRKSEAILARFAERGLRWTALAPPEVYGAHDPGGYVRFVYDRVRSRRFVLLGDGENRWSFCNVKNVADAVLHVAGGPGRGVVHVADDRPTSQRELATALARALGRRAVFPRVPRSLALPIAGINAAVPRPFSNSPPLSPAHVRARTSSMILDTSRLAAAGFTPRFGLDEGIAEAVAWWKRFSD